MPRLISRADMARLAKVTGAAITKASRKQFAAAMVGDRIHVDHPDAVAYLATRGAKPPTDHGKTKPAKPVPSRPGAKTPAAKTARRGSGAPTARGRKADDSEPELDVAKYGHLTYSEIVRKFGTQRQFRDVLDAVIKIQTAREKKLNNDEADGRLISKEGVRAHMFGAIESCFRRLLQDTPRTMAMQLLTAAKAGITLEEAETLIRGLIASQLTSMKESAARLLRDGG
jgi:hypothetical protein